MREEGANTQSMALGNPLIDCFRVFYTFFLKKICVFTGNPSAQSRVGTVLCAQWVMGLSDTVRTLPFSLPCALSCLAPVHEDKQFYSSCWVALSVPEELLPPCHPRPCAPALPLVLSAAAGTRWVRSGRPCATALGCYVLKLNIEESEELQSRSIGWGACGGPAIVPELGVPG